MSHSSLDTRKFQAVLLILWFSSNSEHLLVTFNSVNIWQKQIKINKLPQIFSIRSADTQIYKTSANNSTETVLLHKNITYFPVVHSVAEHSQSIVLCKQANQQ